MAISRLVRFAMTQNPALRGVLTLKADERYNRLVVKHWIQLGIGAWIFLSPWLLGFSSISVMKWSNVAAGAALILINLWIIFGSNPK